MDDDISTLIRQEIAKQEIARQAADDVPLRKLYNVLRAAAAAIEELMGSPAQDRKDGIIAVSVSCPHCGATVRVIRTPTEAGQRIVGTCAACGRRVEYH